MFQKVRVRNMRLLFATTNSGKLREARQILSGLNINLFFVADFAKLKNLQVEENGETFSENALLKAQAYGDRVKILTIAEDTGLVVDVLDGKPGVKSARFGSSVEKRNQKLLQMMKGKKDRTARFVSVFCLYDPKTKEARYFKGEVKGKIATETKGNQGFGYDPLFIPEGYNKTFAELGAEVKNKISHRKQAIEKLKILMLS